MSLADIGAIAGGLNRGIDLAQRDQEFEQTRSMRNEMFDQQRKDWALRNEQSDDTKQKLARERIGKDKLAEANARRYGSATPGSEAVPAPTQTPAQAPVQNATPLPAAAGDTQQAEYIKAWNADENPGVVTTPIPDQTKIESSDATQVAPVANAAPQLPAGGPAQAATPPVAQPAAQAPQAPKEQAQQPMTELEYLRKRHSILSEMHDFAGADKVEEKINAVQKLVDADNFNLLRNSAGQMTDAQFADAAAKTLNADGTPVMTKPPEFKDGKWEFTFYNKHSKHEQVGRFGNKAEMMSALQNHMDRDTYVANANAARAKQDQIDIANAKNVVLSPGAMAFGQPDPVTGKRQQVAVNTNLSPAEARLLDLERRMSGGAGAGAGAGGKAHDPIKPYVDAFELSATKGDGKLNEEAMFRGNSYLPTLASQGINAQEAALIARDAALDPTKTRLERDHDTGRIDRVYANPNINGGRPVRIAANAGSETEFEKQAGGKDALRKDAQSMLDKMVSKAPEESREKLKSSYMALATDQKSREAFLKSQLDAGGSPQVIDNLRRQLTVIGSYANPAKPQDAPSATPTPSAKDRLNSVAGLPPGLANLSRDIVNEKSEKNAADLAKKAKEKEAAAERAAGDSKLIAQATAIPVEAINRSTDLNELESSYEKYGRFLSPSQHNAMESRISLLRRQSVGR